jgi:hypothetical protein
MKYTLSLKLKLIYVFRINSKTHDGCLKIGEATSDSENIWGLEPNSKVLNDAAKKRINQYTQTAGISYDLLYTEVAVHNEKGFLKSFSDNEVHHVLMRSGIERKVFDTKNKANEWFVTDLETVKNAIKAVIEGRDSLGQNEKSNNKSPVLFRPEQSEAIEKTKKQFKKGNEMLWFAKMRFGKTLSALQVVKDLNFTRTLILTHRPVVDAGWFDDFDKIFYDSTEFKYGSKKNGNFFLTLEKQIEKENSKYIYFASMQDLRGSSQVGGNFDKNNEIFKANWDLLIVDEAHEGTQTDLGRNVMSELIKSSTKVLHLSGTPFNLLDNYKEEEIFTWDYVMEQKAKNDWDIIHMGDPNPYSSLPKLNIFTYDLGKLISKFVDEEAAFNFREFFKVNKEGHFLHEKDIGSFLNLICKEDKDSQYPYSSKIYRDNFRHSLWMVPGVKEAKALSLLLNSHSVFGQFKIVNVAGDGDEEEAKEESLEKVKNAISNKPHETYTITISCGRLTTGVSVPAWTAVFMLSGSFNTSASSYMQTIFRVQTPAIINGRIKEECFVFDFAPDRTLKVIAETAKISSKAGKTTNTDRETMGEFLNFCPIISVSGSRMIAYSVEGMLEQLKKVYVERVVRNGFEDGYLYNNDQLMKLDDVELKDFNSLKGIIGSTKSIAKSGNIDINNQGFTDEQYSQLEVIEKKSKTKKELSEDEKQLLKEKEERRKNRDSAISILRGISIRMPLLIYGADVKDEDKQISIENFTELIDEKSWDEFMPKGVNKQVFENFKKYYEPDVFRAAGKRIRAMVRAADDLSIEERISRITTIFGTFRNPDKETVLTPWRVVNMHLGDCLGGYLFFDEKMENTLEMPRYVDKEGISENVFGRDSKVLEINSKSGLYPLFMAYGIYRKILDAKNTKDNYKISLKEQLEIWDKVVEDNIFVLCKTPMAKSITKRTLIGFRNSKVNMRYFEDLVNQITNKQQNFLERIKQGKSYWKSNNNDNMKFNVIVGNPPYQEMDGGAQASATPIYNKFVEISKKINPQFISLIMPSRWMTGGKGLDSFREEMINDKNISILHDFENAKNVFNNVEIKGGICYFLRDSNHSGKCSIFYHKGLDEEPAKSLRFLKETGENIFIRDGRLISIKNKIQAFKENSINTIISSMKPYGLRGDFIDNPEKFNLPPISAVPINNGITIIGLQAMKRVKMYVQDEYPLPKIDGLNDFKIFVPRNYGSGKLGEPISNTILATPRMACTETFVQIFPFSNMQETEHCNKYLKTKFFRLLLGIRKQDQGAGREVYKFVPIQNFTKDSDIDWSKTINEIDKQLYSKYSLADDEISIIEKTIKAME